MDCKITDKDGYTRRGLDDECLWGRDITHAAKGAGQQLCTRDLIHFNRDPVLALLMNPIQGNYDERTMLMWACRAEGKIVSDGVNCGAKTVTTLREIAVPKLSLEQRVYFSIVVVKAAGFNDPVWDKWAEDWLSGEDRSVDAAYAAEAAIYAADAARYTTDAAAAAYDAACAARDVAANASGVARDVADAATHASGAAADAARTAVHAIDMVANAMIHAAYAATHASGAVHIDLVALAQEAYAWQDNQRGAEGVMEGEDDD